MRKTKQRLLIVCIIMISITAAACTANNTETIEQTATVEPATATPEPTLEPTATPTPEPTPEPTAVPNTMEYIKVVDNDSMPEGYSYSSEEQVLSIETSFGKMTFNNIIEAGMNNNGYFVFRDSSSNQDIWVESDIFFRIADFNHGVLASGELILNRPEFENIEVELAYYMAQADLFAIMIVLDEINVSFNDACKINFSTELKEFALKCQERIRDDRLELYKAETAYFAKLLDSQKTDTTYAPSWGSELYKMYRENNTSSTAWLAYDKLLTQGEGMKEIYIEFLAQNYERGVRYDYMLKNTNLSNPYIQYDRFIEATLLTYEYYNSPTVELYNQIQKLIFSEDTNVATALLFKRAISGLSAASEFLEQVNEKVEYGERLVSFKTLILEISSQILEIEKLVSENRIDPFATPVTDYLDHVEVIIPDLSDGDNS